MPAQLLGRQIELYGEQAEELKADHEQGPIRFDIEDVVSLGLSTLENVRRRNRLWNDAVESGQQVFDWEDSRRFAQVCKLWLQATALILERVAESEASGYTIDRADELRAAYRDLSLTSLDVDRLRASYESLHEGRGIPHAQAMNDLRDHLQVS